MQQSLPIYAGMLCDQVGLKFTMGGDTAWSAGGHVNLPALPYNDPEVSPLAFGLIMHESGHEKDTDYQVWGTIKHDPALSNMVNRLEDIRIEKKQIQRFAGGKVRLQTMVEGLCKTGYWRAPQEGDSPSTLLGMAVLYGLRASVLSQSRLKAWGDEALDMLRKAIPAALADHLVAIAMQVVFCKNTTEVVGLAASILDLLKEEKEKLEEQEAQQQQQAQQGQGQGQSQAGQSGQGGNRGQQAEEEQGQSNGNGQGSASPQGQNQNGNSGPAQQGQGQTGGNPQSGVSGGENGDPGKQAEAISKILQGEEDLAPGDIGKTICEALTQISEEASNESVALPKAVKSAVEVGETTEILTRINGASRALQTRVHRLFEATAKKKRSYREEGRRIDPSRLWRPKTGDYRVFVEKLEAPRTNTAVQLLVDVSGSMNHGDRLEAAVNASLAIATALHKLNGVKVATASFPAVGSATACEEERVSVIHTFEQRPEAAAKRFAAMHSNAYTPTAEAMLWAGNELMRRKEDRKILFVLTDGYPEMPGRERNQYRKLAVEVRESLEDAGIEVIGVGIGIDVSATLPNSIQVNSLDELAGSIFALMSKTLFKKAA